MQAGELTHGAILERAGTLGLATALAQLPDYLGRLGLLERARKQSAATADDTLAALVAYVLPGDDAFSEAQGESHPAPGGVDAGAMPLLRAALDSFTDGPPPASAGVALLLNEYAREVDPAACRGRRFKAPFARLSHGDKLEVFRRFEADPRLAGTELAFAARILPGFVAFIAFSKAGVYAPSQRAIARRVVGWEWEDERRRRRRLR